MNTLSTLFLQENLWNCLRSDWIKCKDLDFVEDELIAGVEQYLPELDKFCQDLEKKALGLAAAQAAKEEALKAGTVGLGEVKKKGLTRPISPNITQPRPHPMPEPEQIPMKIEAKDVPEHLNKLNLERLAKERRQELENQRQKTQAQYHEKHHFKLNESKAGKSKDELRREVEEERTKDLAFDASFVNTPPDFNKIPAKVRVNVSTILREDYLYRKQQAKDAQILRNYEEELRDPTEYYAWQQEMKERDARIKLEQVVLRREQAKQSAEEAKDAMVRQRQDNHVVASLLREQAEAIIQQKELEKEIAVLQNQEAVQAVTEETERRKKEARDKLNAERVDRATKIREELEAARLAKEEEDRLEEEMRADKIRQLRAENTVHKKHVVVFDPTEVAGGHGVLDEMSYLEMKVRLENEKKRAEELEELKRNEIVESKRKRAKELEERALSVLRARQVKAEATKEQMMRKKEAEKRESEMKEQALVAAALKLDREMIVRREEKRAEAAALKAEEERIRRQQQYLGAAAGLVEEKREEQQLLGLDREVRASQFRSKEKAEGIEASLLSDKANRHTLKKRTTNDHAAEMKSRELQALSDKVDRMEKIKQDVLRRKSMAREGREQFVKTKSAIVEHNPYAASISQEIHDKTSRMLQRSGASQLVPMKSVSR